ncbi:MAG: dihydroorotate dehydrogenase [Chlamydiales bacterium]|nr:dihydroorotate dehydrogenase [Chlamydiales bacterium]
MNPIYAIDKDYLENAEKGPFFQGEIPKRLFPPKEEWVEFLGFKVATPIGVPAGPLLNSRWVAFAAQMGFDVLTYKTIRSGAHPAHPLPNMVYVDTKGDLTEERVGKTLYVANRPPRTLRELAATNSFGIPCRDPEYILEDIPKAEAALQAGQVMIVSVVGTPRPGEDYVEDFANTARLARRAGAKIIEADLSCPNISGKEGSLFSNPDSVAQITKRMADAIDVPLVIKVGALFDMEMIRAVLKAAKNAGASAVCGINTVSMEVCNKDGTPALGENRRKAGVCGSSIRQAALDFVRKAHQVNEEENLGLTLMATGGVTEPFHFDEFLDAGAQIAMSALGMMWNPYLAIRREHAKRICT